MLGTRILKSSSVEIYDADAAGARLNMDNPAESGESGESGVNLAMLQ